MTTRPTAKSSQAPRPKADAPKGDKHHSRKKGKTSAKPKADPKQSDADALIELTQFQHPCISAISDTGRDDRGLFIVTERVSGATLEELSREAAFMAEEVVEMTRQILDLMSKAESAKLNLAYLNSSHIVVGLSVDDEIRLTFSGLKLYSEADSDVPRDDGLTDLGLLLYRALTQIDLRTRGSLEDESSDGPSRVREIAELREDLPQAVSDWIMRLLGVRPGKPYATANGAKRGFERLLSAKQPKKASTKPKGAQEKKEKQASPDRPQQKMVMPRIEAPDSHPEFQDAPADEAGSAPTAPILPVEENSDSSTTAKDEHDSALPEQSAEGAATSTDQQPVPTPSKAPHHKPTRQARPEMFSPANAKFSIAMISLGALGVIALFIAAIL
ncbi:MAG: hypothetical protein AAF236_02450 [Verrucomicrobiota bacterium]